MCASLLRLLAWPLAVCLGVSVGVAQSGYDEFERVQAEEERLRSEHERDLLFQGIIEARSQAAHERLEDAASTIQPEAFCPAFVSQSPEPRTFQKRISGPLQPRLAPSPRQPWKGVASPDEAPSTLFSDFISSPIVQSKCIYCHVEGGASGHTRLVLTPQDVSGHAATNLAVFQNFVDTVEGGADLILNKIQGAEAHGGGVQVVAGSTDFANMERFLRALGGQTTSGLISPDMLFDGVTMASSARTLRRAALLFAGRLPTQAELNAVIYGDKSALRRTIRGLMTGQGFHDFLIRSANDRLLTDAERRTVVPFNEPRFVDLTNKRWELADQAVKNGHNRLNQYPPYKFHEQAVQYGMARAPLELIAHVVENDLPYTEILTADYIMANPVAAAAYGADTEFDNPEDPTEFKPSEILSYYRRNNSQIVERDDVRGRRVINPGNLRTDYPHAGVLNTTVFLRRYPTTPTNRNRARSRWTYYHFLGFDIEKSAARTTDPDALADTNNPTMNNPACTVCHIPMDPVAGTYQNYGNDGLFRDKGGGMDSLPNLYKYPKDGTTSPYQRGDTWFRDVRAPGFDGMTAPSADNSLQWLAERMVADERFASAAVRFWWPAVMGVELVEPPTESSDSDFNVMLVASSAQALEIDALAQSFRDGFNGGTPYNAKDLLAEIALSPWFRAESVTGDDETRMAALRDAGVARLLTPEELVAKTDAITGYVWGRRFQLPFGFEEPRSKLHSPSAFSGYQLLYGGIDSNGITERTGDMTALMASVAQSHAVEVSCPIVRRELFYWPDQNRLLFDGITRLDTPLSEGGGLFEITATSADSQQLVALEVSLLAGSQTVNLAFANNSTFGQKDSEGNNLDRNLNLDRLVVRDSGGAIVSEVELETLDRQGCGRPREGFYFMRHACSLQVPIQVASSGEYTVEILAYQEQAGDQAARLEVDVRSERSRPPGEMAIRGKLADLHKKFYGVTVGAFSPDVNEAFDLFLEVWNRRRTTGDKGFFNGQLVCADGGDHAYFDGLADDALFFQPGGASNLDYDVVRALRREMNIADSNHIAEAWVVTLAYMLTDYRYLYF
ncbi:MAG: hypothetical protein F4Y47_19055 [Acidobacteriia bacterium]|nr:hypothetical protein [Terriglobia bacterium]MYG01544.1 hypothetical protein [Terriglobia bacterium]MYK08201.1 hypothetical protein [Terriglobia bacterium]